MLNGMKRLKRCRVGLFVLFLLALATIHVLLPTGVRAEEFGAATCNGAPGVDSAIGCIPTGYLPDFLSFFLKWALGISGGVIILLIISTGYSLLTSAGNPEKLQAVKENVVSIISGVVLILFSLVLLQTIGAGVLGLPTF
jgi:hypothetical protein